MDTICGKCENYHTVNLSDMSRQYDHLRHYDEPDEEHEGRTDGGRASGSQDRNSTVEQIF